MGILTNKDINIDKCKNKKIISLKDFEINSNVYST